MTGPTLSLAAALLATTRLLAADWPQFRGPHGNGVADADDLPARLDPAQSIVWTADLPGRGLSSPVVIGDRVFITSASGPQQDRLHVFCFDARDGSKRWERQFWATGRTMTQSKTCVAAPTPVSDGRRLFALFSSNDLIGLDLDGNLLWLRGLTRDYPNASNSLGLASSPIIVGETLIVQIENDSESFAAGLDAATGVNRWKLDRPKDTAWSTPVVLQEKSGRQVVAFQSKPGVTGVLPADGRVVWSFEFGNAIPSLTAGGGVLYVPSRFLIAIQPDAGSATPKELWRTTSLGGGTPSPLLLGDRLVVLSGAGKLSCGKTATGERLWSLQLKGPFSSSPVAAGTKLCAVNEKGLVTLVDLSKPQGEILSQLDLGQTVLCTPAIAHGALYIRSDATLWKLAEPGRPRTP